MPSVTIIANPAAGHGAAGSRLTALAEALAALGVAAETRQTTHPGHASALAQAAREQGCDRLIVAGGDGTLHEVAHGLLSEPGRGPGPAVGILPSGTGSDFVKMLKQPEDTGALARFLLETPPRSIDAARAGDRYMVNTLGIGFDAQVGIQARNLRRDARILRGPAVYALALARALLSYRAPPMTIASPSCRSCPRRPAGRTPKTRGCGWPAQSGLRSAQSGPSPSRSTAKS